MTNSLLISEMRLYRTASEKPYVVEYCQSEGDIGAGESVVREKGNYLIISINKSFGKVFKQIKIYPEKEADCPEPPFVGKYPNSRCLSCTEYIDKTGITFSYVSNSKAEDIYNFYRDKLKDHYKKAGYNCPERAWKYRFGYGIKIELVEIIRSWIRSSNQITPLPTHIPANGLVSCIQIDKLLALKGDYSLIKVYYLTDSKKIDKEINKMKDWYP